MHSTPLTQASAGRVFLRAQFAFRLLLVYQKIHTYFSRCPIVSATVALSEVVRILSVGAKDS